MSADVNVIALAGGEYAVEAHRGDRTRRHQVIVTQDFINDLALPEVDRPVLVEQALRELLERDPNKDLPGKIDLAALSEEPGFCSQCATA